MTFNLKKLTQYFLTPVLRLNLTFVLNTDVYVTVFIYCLYVTK